MFDCIVQASEALRRAAERSSETLFPALRGMRGHAADCNSLNRHLHRVRSRTDGAYVRDDLTGSRSGARGAVTICSVATSN
jgi:hypothetical protein